MNEMRDLYQEVILDHYKKPRNHQELGSANHKAHGKNPLCGDDISVFAKINNGVIEDLSFVGNGCAISQASASMMTESVKGKTLEEAQNLFEHFHDLLTKKDMPTTNGLGKLEVFSGVREFPARVKCASLSWHTLRAAIEDKDGIISTE